MRAEHAFLSTMSKGALPAGIYVISTPLGNARDVTLRALDVLAAVDVVLCEDTRMGARLMAIHAIRTPRTAL